MKRFVLGHVLCMVAVMSMVWLAYAYEVGDQEHLVSLLKGLGVAAFVLLSAGLGVMKPLGSDTDLFGRNSVLGGLLALPALVIITLAARGIRMDEEWMAGVIYSVWDIGIFTIFACYGIRKYHKEKLASSEAVAP